MPILLPGAVLELRTRRGRDKLMSIPAFARAYEYLMSLHSYLHSLPIWQAMLKRARAVKGAVRRISAFAKKWAASLKAG
jgi:hypothetical protein